MGVVTFICVPVWCSEFNSTDLQRWCIHSFKICTWKTFPLISQKPSWKVRSRQVSADTTYFSQEMKLFRNHQRLHLITELMYSTQLGLININDPFINTVPMKILVVNTNSPSSATLLTIRLKRASNNLFKRTFIIWYFEKGINMHFDRFFWRGQNYLKKEYCFPQC